MQPEDGIYILSDNPEYADAPIGADAVELLGLHDVVFEYEMTSNRVDCFGHDRYCQRGSCNLPKEFGASGGDRDR